MLHDGSDVEVPLPSSRGASSVSGSRSDYDLESASEISDAQKKSSVKKKAAQSSRPAVKKNQTGESGRSGGSNAFLTAAEMRAKEKKEGKSSAESPYEFLKDVRDVRTFVTSPVSIILTAHTERRESTR